MAILPLAHLTPRRTEWLWPGHLPIGNLVLLDGDPGVGKSMLTLDLCARLTTGQEFPDGAPAVEPCNVLIVNAEDSAREWIQPRLVAARADLARVSVWNRNPGEPWFRLPGDVGELDAAMARVRPRYVVLDPLTAFLDAGLNLSSEYAARNVLSPLTDLAAKYGCVIQLIRHLSKKGGQRALYRGLHSIGIVAACRLAWLVGRDPRVPNRYVLAQEKANVTKPQPSLAYTISTHSSGHAVLDWHGPVTWTADDLVSASSVQGRRRFRAVEFLEFLLRDGPRPARDIARAAREEGISRRTLRRAYQDLGIRSQQAGTYENHRSWWLRPGQKLPDAALSPECGQLDATRKE